MKLPNCDKAVIPQKKLCDYLLSASHPIGRFKAIIFNELGYNQSNWVVLQTDLKGFLTFEAFEKEITEFGTKYEICGALSGPNGKSIYLVTAWIVLNEENFPRFITAYPGDR